MVVGTTLSQRYRLVDKIASGGMGTVYEAVDERLGRRVAVKVLSERLLGDPRFVERFRREARAVAALSHPNIAGVFDYGEEDDGHYIVMELIDGEDIARVLRNEGPFDPDRTAHLAAQVADALGHAHAAGVIHRDVKPANVLLTDDDRVKVTDFGIARAAGETTLTATGMVLGTAHYISPEHASGTTVVPASDVYSLGILLYEMLTGSVPFTADTPIGVAMRHISDEVPPPSELNTAVPPHLDDVVTTATAKDPIDRYPDGAALADALRGGRGIGAAATVPAGAMAAAGAGTTLPLTPATEAASTVWPIPGDRWDPDKLGRAVLIAFVVLAVIAAGLLLWRLAINRAEPQPRSPAGAPAEATVPEETPVPAGIEVPSVVGDNFKDAKEVLEAEGFEVEEEKVPADADKDEVIDQEPEGGERAPEGSTVTLTVSEGPEEEEDEKPPDEKGPPPGKGPDKEDD